MHWGLTAFERKRIERIALDHPYFDMHAPLLTKKELRTILAQDPRKTGSQVVAEVKKELGIAYAPATQKKRTLAEALRDASFVPSFRRTVVLAVLSLLLVLFMTLTVPGRAFAEELYYIIVNYVGETLRIQNSTPSFGPETPDFSMLRGDVDSPQALSDELNYPIIASEDTLTSFSYELIGSDVLSIRSKYLTKEGKKCTIFQEIHGKSSLWTFNYDIESDYQKLDTIPDINLFVGHSTDGSVFVTGYSDSYSIRISSREMTIPEIVAFAEQLIY